MLHLQLANNDEQPLYLQIYRQVRDHIRSGSLASGARLPSVRALQLQFHMSKTPIETAYQMLTAEGYIVSRPRSGLYVMNPLEASEVRHKPAPSYIPSTPPLLQHEQHSSRPEIGSVLDFRASTTDSHLFPIRIWQRMLQHAFDQHAQDVCRYGDSQGEYSFRAVIAEYLYQARGVRCVPEQIVIGSGIRYSLSLIAALFDRSDIIAIEDPGYAPVHEQFTMYGYSTLPIPVHEKGLSIEQLEQSEAKAVYVTPSHQFPTGSVMPYSERELLLRWAQTRHGYIIEDDYDGEFRYQGKPIPALQGLDEDGRVIYIGTFSKAFTPALRLNYMVLPLPLVSRLTQIKAPLDAPSRMDQWAMQAFFTEGHWFRHIRRMRSAYRKKHNRLIALLEDSFGECISITGHSAGLHIQLTIRTALTASELVGLAADVGVRVYDLAGMLSTTGSRNEASEPRLYLGFGGLNERQLEQGVRLLQQAWEPALAEKSQ